MQEWRISRSSWLRSFAQDEGLPKTVVALVAASLKHAIVQMPGAIWVGSTFDSQFSVSFLNFSCTTPSEMPDKEPLTSLHFTIDHSRFCTL